ncbi:MAG: HEAT repeat domain-containing protein [Planctomycetes bacterium]|nr:HEAT repeat domain-containing protein [Planctomycetota bacterium]
MRMLWVLGLAALLAFPAGTAWSAEGEDAPKADEPAPYGEDANNLPLEVFKELKNLYDALRGAQAPDAQKITKGDAKKALAQQVPEKKDALIKALQARQVLHREFAAQVLGTWEDAEARKPALECLHEALAKDSDANVRRAIARTLALFKDANSRDALAKALDDKDVGVRALAVQALGEIKDPAVKDRLLRTLKEDDDATIRMRAAMALGKLNDKSTLDALMQALQDEKHPMVQRAIAKTVRDIRGKDTPATEGIPTNQEQGGKLAEMANRMKEVEEKLRNDRHDQAVQVEQKKIEDQLAQMIEEIKKQMAQASPSQGQQQQQSQGQQPQQSQGQQAGKQPSSPLNDSALSGQVPPGHIGQAAEVTGVKDAWANLPPAVRDEMLQVYREGIPPRWKKRLEAYYLSIAAEEDKNTNK